MGFSIPKMLNAQILTKYDSVLFAKHNLSIHVYAGFYSADYDVLGISVCRGTANTAAFDTLIQNMKDVLTELNIPHKFFVKHNERRGTIFYYFIENDLNGPFSGDMAWSMLPEILRDFKAQYPEKFTSTSR